MASQDQTTIAIVSGNSVVSNALALQEGFVQTLGGASVALQENGANQPQPERYYSESIRLPTDRDSAGEILRGVFYKRTSLGWKLVSATKEPNDNALLLEWDTLGSLPK